MTRTAIVLAMAANLLGVAVQAQQAAVGAHSVHGVVFDSVAMTPLTGAVVQVTFLDSVSRVFAATSDGAGRYRMTGLPAGRFLVGLEHEAARALRLELPLRTFELEHEADVTVDVAIPSGASLVALHCAGLATLLGDGLLAGFVRDAVTGEELTGATVLVEWTEVSLNRRNVRTERHRVDAPADASGTYLACGIPGDTPVGVRVTSPGHRPVVGQLKVPANGVTRRDFRLADSATVRGPATLEGQVMHDDGRPVASGLAALPALSLETPVRRGEFVLRDLPLGTWAVELRVIGLEPLSTFVEVADSGRVARIFSVGAKAQALETVRVMGSPSRAHRALADVLERKRLGFGSIFLAGQPSLAGATRITDVFREARGFRYLNSADSVVARGTGALGGTTCDRIAVYINGDRWLRASLRDVSDMIPARDVLAVEAYSDMMFVPAEWRTGDSCAVVSVLTKR